MNRDFDGDPSVPQIVGGLLGFETVYVITHSFVSSDELEQLGAGRGQFWPGYFAA